MKKILFLLFAAAAFAACNDDGEPKVRYAQPMTASKTDTCKVPTCIFTAPRP